VATHGKRHRLAIEAGVSVMAAYLFKHVPKEE